MIHPYIDCMIRLAQTGLKADQIARITCPTGEGVGSSPVGTLGRQAPPALGLCRQILHALLHGGRVL
jgi:hypothetical protein